MSAIISQQQLQQPPPSLPVIIRDPRFVVGRATIGRSTAIDVFETLLHEAISKYGGPDNDTDPGSSNVKSDSGDINKVDVTDTSTGTGSIIETAPAYYEYGNALLRFAIRQKDEQKVAVEECHIGVDDSKAAPNGTTTTTSTTHETPSSRSASRSGDSKKSIREAIAAAAERRAQLQQPNLDTKELSAATKSTEVPTENKSSNIETVNNQEEDENDDADDIELALEMMETSWSILDAYHEEMQQRRTVHNREASNGIPTSTGHRNKNYDHWVLEQIPRVLTGMGDALAMLQRHADAVDAYLRALDHRQTALDDYLRTIQNRNDIGNGGVRTTAVATTATTSSTTDSTNDVPSLIQLLKYRRQVVEVTVLVVEELLACGNDHDVITTESQIVLVSKGNVIEYARGYYDRARSELQETVLLLGQIVAMVPNKSTKDHHSSTSKGVISTMEKSIQEEKENICYVATMIMGAGTTLAEIDEFTPSSTSVDTEPKKKRSKSAK